MSKNTWIDNLPEDKVRNALRAAIEKQGRLEGTVSELQRKLSQNEKNIRSVAKQSPNHIYFKREWMGRPCCSEHGAMNRVSADGMYRCIACNVGVSMSEIMSYILEEWDGVYIVK